MKVWQILGTCLLVALVAARMAKAKGKSPWLWGVLGFTVFGIVFHSMVGILIFFLFG